ncbi:MAG: hypothetical protein OEW11_04285 [Nitrospirota bacterium]|nr:hypothetical protein [Nitrospirota bacterium]
MNTQKTLKTITAAAALWAMTATAPALALDMVKDGGGGTGGEYFVRGVAVVLGNYGELGLQYMAASVAMAPENMVRHTYLSGFLDLPRYQNDVAVLESVHRVAPLYAPAMERLARAYESQQRYADAEAIYGHWISRYPAAPEPLARLAELHYFNGDYKSSLQQFEHYRSLVGDSEYALRRMIDIQERTGNARGAKRLTRQLAQLQRETEKARVAALSQSN